MMHPATGQDLQTKVEVIIVANFASTDGTGNCRFGELAHRLAEMGADVELLTSDFEHDNHTKRRDPIRPDAYKLTLLHEPGYRKNISLKRLVSQQVFAKSVEKYLDSRQSAPDLVYCATPSPAAARVCAQYSRRHGNAFVVDVQDLWPDAFGMSFRMPRAINFLFQSMIRSSRIAYRQADLVVGVSGTYVAHAEHTAGQDLNTSVVFLGGSLAAGDQVAADSVTDKTPERISIVYAGTLSHSYDLPMVIDAMASLSEHDARFSELEFAVLGDGPKRQEFEHYARHNGVNVQFLGKLPYSDMLGELRSADIAVNPIVAGSMGSVLNKAGDYGAAGLPVINTQESPEYRDLLDRYESGRNCANGSISDVADAIRELVDNPDLRSQMGRNGRRMAEDLFDRDKTYDALVRNLLALTPGNVQAKSTESK